MFSFGVPACELLIIPTDIFILARKTALFISIFLVSRSVSSLCIWKTFLSMRFYWKRRIFSSHIFSPVGRSPQFGFLVNINGFWYHFWKFSVETFTSFYTWLIITYRRYETWIPEWITKYEFLLHTSTNIICIFVMFTALSNEWPFNSHSINQSNKLALTLLQLLRSRDLWTDDRT